MQNLKELWELANEQAKTNGGDAFEIYARLSGAKIVSEYSDEAAEKLKAAGYKFRIIDANLYFTPLSGKEKILPIYDEKHRHIFSEAGLIVDNRAKFWLSFICANFSDEAYEVKKQFERLAHRESYQKMLKDFFGIIEDKPAPFGIDESKKFDKFVKSIPNLKMNGDSVPFEGAHAIHRVEGYIDDVAESLYFVKSPMSKDEIKIYEDFAMTLFDIDDLGENVDENNIFEKIAERKGISPNFRSDFDRSRLNHLTIETGDENRTELRDVKGYAIETLLPLVKKGGGELDFIHSDFKGWSVDIRPLDRLLPFCWVFDILKDGKKKITCVLNGADYRYLAIDNHSVKNIFFDAWLKQTDITEFEKINEKICDGNMLFVSVQNLTHDCIDATTWLADFERCLAFAILTGKEQG